MRRNMSMYELQARRQQRFTVWAMVALALLAVSVIR
jgi:predicted nucleic acid-binding Zn ribbon protein